MRLERSWSCVFQRGLVVAAFLSPGCAVAQPKLSVEQVGSERDAASAGRDGLCSAEACRITLLVDVGYDRCIVFVRLDVPDRDGSGMVSFTAGPCVSGNERDLTDTTRRQDYRVSALGTMSRNFFIAFQLLHRGVYSDGVFRPGAMLRIEVNQMQRTG